MRSARRSLQLPRARAQTHECATDADKMVPASTMATVAANQSLAIRRDRITSLVRPATRGGATATIGRPAAIRSADRAVASTQVGVGAVATAAGPGATISIPATGLSPRRVKRIRRRSRPRASRF